MFSFINFNIKQSDTVFKITTDSLVLAGLCQPITQKDRVLDVGTGTGVLSFLLKDRFPNLTITGIDIQKDAVNLANENKRLFYLSDGMDFLQNTIDQCEDRHYDLIISNPPYFNNDLSSQLEWKNKARHQYHFDLFQFFSHCARTLKPQGKVELIYPVQEKDRLLHASSSAHLFPQKMIYILDRALSKPKLLFISLISRHTTCTSGYLELKDTSGQYSKEYRSLLQGWVNWSN